MLFRSDVARAFFEAPVTREVCVELPEEDLEPGEKAQDLVARLKMSLYGTRDAAANFQEEVRRFMEGNGFTQGRYNPCTYYNQARQLRSLVHGDDFVTVGSRMGTQWLRGQMCKRFEIKTKYRHRPGGGAGGSRPQ